MKKTLLHEFISNSTEETENIGKRFATEAKKEKSHIFVAMYGDLGAGKTAFVRGAARAIAPTCDVTSPTYTIVNEYICGKNKLCHFDMYRITGEEDLLSVGYYDYTDCDIIIEWSEKIEYALPSDYFEVRITKLEKTQRQIKIYAVSEE